jgi:hypothetical protein
MFERNWTGPLLVGLVALMAIQLIAMNKIWRLEAQLALVSAEQAKSKEWASAEMTKARATLQGEAAKSLKHLETLRAEITQAKEQASQIAGQAQLAAVRSARDVETRLDQAQRERAAALNGQLTDLKSVTAQAGAKLSEVSGEVSGVKTEVAAAKAELEQTISQLRKVMGDMGVMSGLIATNSKQINALRLLGEREYLEFSLTRGAQPTAVGGVAMQLKKADPGRNRYTLELLVDDRRIEKRDRNRHEPVQFYTASNRQPLEIVVNEIEKDRVVGYVSVPKVLAAR